MCSKPLGTGFTSSGIRIFNSVTSRSLITRCPSKPASLLISPKASLVAESTKRFAANEGPRTLVRQEPGPVRLGFIPDEWFTFFFPKTGVTGLATFTCTFTTYLMSKEFYVMEHEYYGGLSMAILCVLAVKYVGPLIAKDLDRDIDKYEKSWKDLSTYSKKVVEESIKNEEQLQWSSEGQLMVVEAKRENVALQLEAAYRERLMKAYLETRKRLEYCVERSEIEKAIIRRHMTNWVVREVNKALTEQIEKDSVNKCISDLEVLAKSLKGLTTTYPSDVAKVDDEGDPKK